MLLNVGCMKILVALKYGAMVPVGNKYSLQEDGIMTDISAF